jgi:hypothetical protein
MSHRTNVILSTESYSAWKASGLSLGQLVERGLASLSTQAASQSQAERALKLVAELGQVLASESKFVWVRPGETVTVSAQPAATAPGAAPATAAAPSSPS